MSKGKTGNRSRKAVAIKKGTTKKARRKQVHRIRRGTAQSDKGGTSLLRKIAEELRKLRDGKSISFREATVAGRFVAMAIKNGAFARIEDQAFRADVDPCIEKGKYISAFTEAVAYLRRETGMPILPLYYYDGKLKHVELFEEGIPILADQIEKHAKIPKSERVLTPAVPGRLEGEAIQQQISREQRLRDSKGGVQQISAMNTLVLCRL